VLLTGNEHSELGAMEMEPETTATKSPTCELCGDPMPAGEEMFKFHGYSGPCPKPIKPLSTKHAEVTRQRDDLVAALEPFASIGAWLFARPEVPDDEVMVSIEGINGSRGAFTRGQFKAAYRAYVAATAEAGPNGERKYGFAEDAKAEGK
jgi:hypothetical protein